MALSYSQIVYFCVEMCLFSSICVVCPVSRLLYQRGAPVCPSIFMNELLYYYYNELVSSHLHNRAFTIGTAWREELMVVFVTVRLSISLKEACGAQLHLTHCTHKVFRVPHFTQCCDHLAKKQIPFGLILFKLTYFDGKMPSSLKYTCIF